MNFTLISWKGSNLDNSPSHGTIHLTHLGRPTPLDVPFAIKGSCYQEIFNGTKDKTACLSQCSLLTAQ